MTNLFIHISFPDSNILSFFELIYMSYRCLHNKFVCLHSQAGLAYTNAHFGSGTGSIALDDVQCISSDSQLLECSSRPIFSHNCAHSDDAGVGCEGELDYCIMLTS